MTKSTTAASFDVTKFGTNMKALFDTATTKFQPLPKGRDATRALASLVKAGAVVERNTNGTIEFALVKVEKTKRAPKVKEVKVKRVTSMTKALELAAKTTTRAELVELLQSELNMSKNGASTYASLVRNKLGLPPAAASKAEAEAASAE